MYLHLKTDQDDFSLYVPISIEEHEMDVTAYEYLSEYYPCTSKELRFVDGYSLDLQAGSVPDSGRMSPVEDSLIAMIFRAKSKDRMLRKRIAMFSSRTRTDIHTR